MYLFSHPPTSKKHVVATSDDSFMNGILGTVCLVGYLFFDGLVSTTQERVFGKNPASSDPFGPESPVLDQMIWTNTFAGLIAIASALLTNVTGSLMPNVRLLLTTPALIWDVTVFSAASAFGLIILLNTIASFGALTCSLVMTTRQFLSIILNAGIFGNFGSVGVEGWTGVGWVASGVYIKINRYYDPPKSTAPKRGASDALHQDELEGLAGKEGLPSTASSPPPSAASANRLRQYFFQFVVPVAVPVVLAIFLSPFLYAASGSNLSLEGSSQVRDGTETERSSEQVVIEGGKWSAELHQKLAPECQHNVTTEVYPGKVKTGFVSFPRSGNSYLRSLIERSTGYQTSSICESPLLADNSSSLTIALYTPPSDCDRGLQRTFVGECDHKATFFVKTHFPALPKTLPVNSMNYYKRFDQAVHLVRNPLDSIASWWHLDNSPKTAEGFQDHENRIKIGQFGDSQREEMLRLARRWRDHALYWETAPILTHTLRYEDLHATPIPKMMSLLSFLLPSVDLPSLSDLACMVESDDTHEALVKFTPAPDFVLTPKICSYKSRKNGDFASWDSWSPDLRLEVLRIVRRPFCAFGYDRLLVNKLGSLAEYEGFCQEVTYEEDFGLELGEEDRQK
ncbi:hypothetical protein P7C70_g963, partial [Phenoliferia sp. Uapishka_3]